MSQNILFENVYIFIYIGTLQYVEGSHFYFVESDNGQAPY